MIIKMGWEFGWQALSDLMHWAADEHEIQTIEQTFLSTESIQGGHSIRTRKMGDMIVVDAHIEVDVNLTVHQEHDISVSVRNMVMQKY